MHRARCLCEELIIKLLFAKGPSLTVRLLVLSVLSAALMLVDARLDTLKPLRRSMAQIVTPLYWLAERPQRLWENLNQQLSSRDELIAENEKLKAEALLMQQRLQKLATLTEQNVRLRELLNSSQLVEDRVLVSELLGVDPNPFTQRLLIDKGERDGVFVGQPVLDALGLMGQVVEVMPDASRVLLITDATHSVPVQVNRNGLRFIASGTGNNSERLELRYVPDTADIKPGDLLVSSGLGQRFPAGYPVATVTEVTHDPSQPFALVTAIPTAHLSRSRYLMLVYSEQRAPAPAPVPVPESTQTSPATAQPAASHAPAAAATPATAAGVRPAGTAQPAPAAARPAGSAPVAARSSAAASPAATTSSTATTVPGTAASRPDAAPARPAAPVSAPAPAAGAPAAVAPRPVVVPGGE